MPWPPGDKEDDGMPPVGEGDEYVLHERDAPTYDVTDRVQRQAASWRAECFIAAGFTLDDALHLASRRDIDRARVEAMLGSGATHAQVVAIVS